jgi:hypothetical protein
MSSPKVRSAEALYPVLSAFHSVGGLSLLQVSRLGQADCTTAYVLDFGSKRLVLKSCPDDDTIELSVEIDDQPEAINVSEAGPWKSFIGQPFGWGWLTTNQQGYIDGAMLSFAGIEPSILLTVAASSISVGIIAVHQLKNQ